jgi:hypothetical protein
MAYTPKYSDDWYDEFWEALPAIYADPDKEYDEVVQPLIRLFAELLAGEVLRRDGDLLIGRGGMDDALRLCAGDQYLIRLIEDAAPARPTGETR